MKHKTILKYGSIVAIFFLILAGFSMVGDDEPNQNMDLSKHIMLREVTRNYEQVISDLNVGDYEEAKRLCDSTIYIWYAVNEGSKTELDTEIWSICERITDTYNHELIEDIRTLTEKTRNNQ